MSFEAPWALLGLIAALIPLLLGFLRLRPRPVRVPSLLIWSRLRERTPPVQEMKRPRLSWTLLLSALAIAFGSVAMASPVVNVTSPEPRHAILVFDTGPRMLTRHRENRTSFQHAVSKALRLLEDLEDSDRVDLIARTAEGVRHAELDRIDAAVTLRSLKAGISPGDLEPLLDRAGEVQARHPDSEVVVFSDRDRGFRTCSTGTRESDNVGIVGLTLTTETAFVRLFNAGPERDIGFSVNGETRTRKVPRGDSSFTIERKAGEAIDIRIENKDNLEADNIARSTKLPGRGGLRVSYVGRERTDLLKALNSLPQVEVLESLESPVDVIVLCEGAVPPQQARVLIALAPEGPVPPFKAGTAVNTSELAFAEGHHITQAILYGVEEISLVGAQEIQPAGTPLISAQGKPICSIDESGDPITLMMSFNPFLIDPQSGAGGWSKKPTFAIFFAALFEHIRRLIGGGSERCLKAGHPADMAALTSVDLLEGDGAFIGGALTAPSPGTLRLKSAEGHFRAHFNLLDEASTANQDGVWAPLESGIFAADREPVRQSSSIGWLFALLCLIFVIAAYGIGFLGQG